ncbi:ATP-binding cassette domain-containing protein [Alloscardovia venturai]
MSHDRDFIEKVATAILDLDTEPFQIYLHPDTSANGIVRCNGRYSDYLEHKAQAKLSHQTAYEQQNGEKSYLISHKHESEHVVHKNFNSKSEQSVSKKFFADRAQAVSTRRKNDDTRRLLAIEKSEIRKPRYDELIFKLPLPRRTTRGISVHVADAQVPGRLAPVSFDVRSGEHLLLTGPNGAGKSTILRWVHERRPITPNSRGVVNAESSVFIPQTLPQPTDELIDEKTWHNGIGEKGKGFLHAQYWTTPLSLLSEGNQRRVQIALAAAQCPSLLLIDEPTNYLDLDGIESLESALKNWPGTLIISSHDQWLIKNWNGLTCQLHTLL